MVGGIAHAAFCVKDMEKTVELMQMSEKSPQMKYIKGLGE